MPSRRKFERGNAAKRLYSTVLLLVAVGIVSYGLFEGRKLIEGPQVVLETPADGSATSSSAVIISGEAHNVSFLTINDAPAFTDESGHFALTLSPPPGYTVFTVAATDRFGRRVSRSVSIQVLSYCPIT